MPSKTLHFPSPRHLHQLYCERDENLAKTEEAFEVSLTTREDWVQIDGENEAIEGVETLFALLDSARSQGIKLASSDFVHILEAVKRGEGDELRQLFENPSVIKLRRTSIVPKTVSQKRYLKFIGKQDVVLGVGPAGTGKTYLAVALALHALQEGHVQKIIITRPAVEAGEALGFLPGDLQEKLLPYLRPLYDAMYDMLGQEDTARMMERGIIEIAPLAYMRGRTLSNAFIILDEAQNTTVEQMKMFLTRLGDGSQMVITGDPDQVDLQKTSGLRHAMKVLADVDGIKIFHFSANDVVRHPLVSRIIKAYKHHAAEPDRH